MSLEEDHGSVGLGLKAHGENKVIMPLMDYMPLCNTEKLFNVLNRCLERASSRGVKAMRDFQYEYWHVVPSEFAASRLFRPQTKTPAVVSSESAI